MKWYPPDPREVSFADGLDSAFTRVRLFTRVALEAGRAHMKRRGEGGGTCSSQKHESTENDQLESEWNYIRDDVSGKIGCATFAGGAKTVPGSFFTASRFEERGLPSEDVRESAKINQGLGNSRMVSSSGAWKYVLLTDRNFDSLSRALGFCGASSADLAGEEGEGELSALFSSRGGSSSFSGSLVFDARVGENGIEMEVNTAPSSSRTRHALNQV